MRPHLGPLPIHMAGSLRSPGRLLVLLAGCAGAMAWQGVGLATRSRVASSAVTMKHNDYYQRLQRAESGRLRLCVFRLVWPLPPSRAPGGMWATRRMVPGRALIMPAPSDSRPERPSSPGRCRALRPLIADDAHWLTISLSVSRLQVEQPHLWPDHRRFEGFHRLRRLHSGEGHKGGEGQRRAGGAQGGQEAGRARARKGDRQGVL